MSRIYDIRDYVDLFNIKRTNCILFVSFSFIQDKDGVIIMPHNECVARRNNHHEMLQYLLR